MNSRRRSLPARYAAPTVKSGCPFDGRVGHVGGTDDPISLDTVTVRFDDDLDGQYGSLAVRGGVDVVVWRTAAERVRKTLQTSSD